MQLRRFKDIIAIKAPHGVVVGFNTTNLESAELSDDAWDAMATPQAPSSEEALSALVEWSSESASLNSSAAQQEFKVSSLTINVTQVCNLACKYCAAGGDGTYGSPVSRISVEQTLPQIKFFMEKLSSGDNFSINFLGGEPLLYPEGMELIGSYVRELAAQRGIKAAMVVTTNGTLFSESVVAMLNRIQCSVVISMDGNRTLTDLQRPSKDGKSTFDKIMTGLQVLSKNRSGIRKIKVRGVYGKNSSEVVNAYQFFCELPVDEFDFSFDHLEISPEANEHFIEGFSKIAELAFTKGGENELTKIHFFRDIFMRIDAKSPVRHYCGAGQSLLSIDAKNNLYTCPWDVGSRDQQVGRDLSLDHVKLADYQGSLVEKNNCQSCWAKNLCGGGCMYIHKNRTGNKNKKDSNFCDRTKHLLALALVYYQRSRAAA